MGPGDLEIWLNHFEHHALHPGRVPHGLGDVLRPDELRLIAGSIATFQLGEQSEGRTFLRAAERFARARQIPHLVKIIDLLIREEQRHASLLQAFMQDHRMPLKRTDWTDRVFRHIRRLGGLELYLGVLISAELIGNVYYRALESVTNCRRLQILCRTLVADELAHVGFEAELLRALEGRRGAWSRALIRAAHLGFFTATATVVFLTHRAVCRRAGHDAQSFVRACLTQFTFYVLPANIDRRALALGTAPASAHRRSCGGTLARPRLSG